MGKTMRSPRPCEKKKEAEVEGNNKGVMMSADKESATRQDD